MLTPDMKRPCATVVTPSRTNDLHDSCGDEVDRWLGRLSHTRVMHVPEVFGDHAPGAGWRLDFPEGFDEHMLYLVVSGSCSATVGEECWDLDTGSLVWIRPRTPFMITTPNERRTVVYRFRLAPDEETDRGLAPALHLPTAGEVRGVFDWLVAELVGHTLPYRSERVKGLLLVLFTTLFRRAEQHVEGGVLSLSARQAIEQFVDENITGRPTVADLAAVAGLSPDYFTRTFRRTFGMPPREWLVRRRIQHAAELLDESNRSIAQVAQTYGYRDSFLFSRQFKSVMGVPPQTYRGR
ncbi:helix-turn-helix transcriptional regulator [Streptomyces cinereoruber]|uniref:helix-turn-helix transcriptional regulator n=1 Tax=Streptomyces cinereoruber TaxID=67260 RepID=UPI0036686336